MRKSILVLALLLPSIAHAREPARTVAGEAYWRDGDTAVVAGVPVRLQGLAAPELREPGGATARAWMLEHTRGQIVTCVLDGSRTRDRWAGICYVRGADVAASLIAAGLGRDCRRWSKGRYAHLETPAGRLLPVPAYCRRRQPDVTRGGATCRCGAGRWQPAGG